MLNTVREKVERGNITMLETERGNRLQYLIIILHCCLRGGKKKAKVKKTKKED